VAACTLRNEQAGRGHWARLSSLFFWGIFCQEPSEVNTLREPGIQMPQSGIWPILRKCLRVRGYRLQVLEALNPENYSLRFPFCVDFQQRLEEDVLAEKLVFDDKATFHVCGNVNHHNVRILGTENPRATMEHVHDSPIVNVFCAVFSCKSTDHFPLRSQLLMVSNTWTCCNCG
jgi:hypothetical protein